jgi:hypothetical protein
MNKRLITNNSNTIIHNMDLDKTFIMEGFIGIRCLKKNASDYGVFFDDFYFKALQRATEENFVRLGKNRMRFLRADIAENHN